MDPLKDDERSDSWIGPWDAIAVALVLIFIYKVVHEVILAKCG